MEVLKNLLVLDDLTATRSSAEMWKILSEVSLKLHIMAIELCIPLSSICLAGLIRWSRNWQRIVLISLMLKICPNFFRTNEQWQWYDKQPVNGQQHSAKECLWEIIVRRSAWSSKYSEWALWTFFGINCFWATYVFPASVLFLQFKSVYSQLVIWDGSSRKYPTPPQKGLEYRRGWEVLQDQNI